MAQGIRCLFAGDALLEDGLQAIYKGAMQSRYLFIEEKKSAKGIRFSLENFARLNQNIFWLSWAKPTFEVAPTHQPNKAFAL